MSEPMHPDSPEGAEFPHAWLASRYVNDDVYLNSDELREILTRLEYWKQRAHAAWSIADIDFMSVVHLHEELKVMRDGA